MDKEKEAKIHEIEEWLEAEKSSLKRNKLLQWKASKKTKG